MADTACRKWQLTINNPLGYGFTHDRIKEELSKLKSLIYWCMSDEVGGKESTPHTHLFVAAKSAIRFSTMKNRFPQAHIEKAEGTARQNRDYIFKEGKWENDEKHGTKVPGTQEEWGELPPDQPGHRSDFDRAFEMLESGCSVMEVIREMPPLLRYKSMLEQTRQELLAERFRHEFRLLDVTYIFGSTGLGKTRYVMEKYGYENVCQITGYQHGCFDKYRGEDVMLFDEFHSSLKIQDMLNFLDGYPLELPCRYANRVACFTKVYIISNIPLELQYPNIRTETPSVWDAFIRRIHQVMVFYASNQYDEFTTKEYLNHTSNSYSNTTWKEVNNDGDMPF
ncbi:MAG TPA: hypothetical protein GX499_04400 [Clostridiales bacterium]|jgi:hypothetical protein|nr:hypothetical protein [Clostridiales bacterium]